MAKINNLDSIIEELTALSAFLKAEKIGNTLATKSNDVFGYYITEIDRDGDKLSFFSHVHPAERHSFNTLHNFIVLKAVRIVDNDQK